MRVPRQHSRELAPSGVGAESDGPAFDIRLPARPSHSVAAGN